MSTRTPAPPEQTLPTILFVDDEEKIQKHFKRLFQNQFRIVTASDGIEALKVFQSEVNNVAVIVTDQRMPNETGTEFLQKAALIKPSVVRILSTAYADVDAAIDSVNKSGIYRYITKPWEVPELEVTLTRAVELYQLKEERDELHRQKMTSLQNLAATERIHSLAALSVFQNTGIRHVTRALETLVQLADQSQGGLAPIGNGAPQWDTIYNSHRHFLEVAHAILPGDLTATVDPDLSKPTAVAPILKEATASDSRFRWTEGGPGTTTWPGPAETLQALIGKLFRGIGVILSQADTLTVKEGEYGIELSISALSLQHGLQPLLNPNFPDGPEKNRALHLTAAFLEWSHYGGTTLVLPDHSSRTVTLRLGLSSPGSTTDPWANLASDLIANDLFWQRHLG
ncbi:MAG: FixJ family two-component response regulator [Akkermansiaceae bacterium]|jgi:FixJ family two-component response regulator